MKQRGKITITEHARKRLAERLPELQEVNYQGVVSAARYKGATINELERNNPEVAKHIKRHFTANNSTQIRYYRNCFFVFSGNRGRARTLVTVVDSLQEKGETVT